MRNIYFQATVENKKAFSEGMKTVQIFDNSNHTKALLFAFDLLQKVSFSSFELTQSPSFGSWDKFLNLIF